MLLTTLITLGTALFHHVRVCSVDRLGVVAVVGELWPGGQDVRQALENDGWTASGDGWVRGDEVASLRDDTLTIRARDLDDTILRRLAATL